MKKPHRNRLLLLEEAMVVTDLLARQGYVDDHRTGEIATDSVVEDVSTVAETVNPEAKSGQSLAAEFCRKFDPRL